MREHTFLRVEAKLLAKLADLSADMRLETTTNLATGCASAPYFSANRNDVTATGVVYCRIRMAKAIGSRSKYRPTAQPAALQIIIFMKASALAWAN